MNKRADDKELFLEEVVAQIAYKPLRPSVVRELEAHIRDRAEEYEKEGLSAEEAEQKAVAAMGDAVTIGTEINAVRHVRTNRPLVILTAVLMTLGFLISCYMFSTSSQSASGYLYYLPGAGILIFTTYKGYPLLVKYWKPLLSFALLLHAVELLYSFVFMRVPNTTQFLPWLPLHIVGFFEILLLAPVLSLALYSLRKQGIKAILTIFTLAGVLTAIRFWLNRSFISASVVICLLSLTGTVIFLIHRRGFAGTGKKQRIRLYGTAAASFLILSSIYLILPDQRELLHIFLKPETDADSMWNDGYNGVLIQELLARTPAAEGLILTQEELVEYGTGRWYFESRDPRQMGVLSPQNGDSSQAVGDDYNKELRDGIPFQHGAADATLWDILPQHYHNNYRIAVAILLYGWYAGIAILAVLAGFYMFLFRCILSIRGKLAGTLSFCCGLCLLLQSAFYVLGNFGCQYGDFTNLPMVSEGRLSIMINMLLLGFIFSAYRYDHVIEENAGWKEIPVREDNS